MKWKAIVVCLVSVVLAAACGTREQPVSSGPSSGAGKPGERIAASGGSFVRVTPEELRRMMEEGSSVVLNVHVPCEGEIPGTDPFIPYDEVGLEHNRGRLPEESRVVLYCMSGSMSTEAAGTLVGKGYDNVVELESGMEAWEKTGFPLASGQYPNPDLPPRTPRTARVPGTHPRS